MHLKVEANGKSTIHSFKGKKKISIGRSSSCDIEVIAEGVSRHHLDILDSNGDLTVVDQGSTNGSFIDDQKLEPKRPYPFNSFFPVRLGLNVSVYLLDETTVIELTKK